MSWALALLVCATSSPEVLGIEVEQTEKEVVFSIRGTAPPSFSAEHDEQKRRLVIDWAGARLGRDPEPLVHPWLRAVRLLERPIESERAVRIVLELGTERAFQLRARKNAIQVVFAGPPPPLQESGPQTLDVALEVEREAAVEVPELERPESVRVPDFEEAREELEMELPPLETSPEVEAALAEAAEAERREAARLEEARREAARQEEAQREAARQELARQEAALAAARESAARRAAAPRAEAAPTRGARPSPQPAPPLASWSPPEPQLLASTTSEDPGDEDSGDEDSGGEREAASEADSGAADGAEGPGPERSRIELRDEASPPRATMTYIGFRMRGRISRVFLRLDRDVDFTTEQSPGRLLIFLPETRVDVENNERPLDTSYFESPVTWVKATTRRDRGRTVTVVEIRLRSSVPWMSKKIGTTLAIDFVLSD